MNYNQDIVEAGRLAWNEISRLVDPTPVIFPTSEEFAPFYEQLVTKLFDDQLEQ